MTVEDRLRRRRATEHKLKEHRDLLVESVQRHILHGFIQQGFVVTRAPSDSPDIFPLGHLQRTRPDGTVDLAEIQFMTYRRAAFRINVCAVPKEGIMTLGGRRTAGEIDAGGLHDHFEMYAYPRWRLWFSLRFWRFRTPTEAEYENLARSVAARLPEVESALRQGELGPHMRKITYPYPSSEQ